MSDFNQLFATVGRIEGKLDEALKADRERLDKIEKAQTRQWWVSIAIAPFLAIAHGFARKFGVNV